jgi:hypothetical protein
MTKNLEYKSSLFGEFFSPVSKSSKDIEDFIGELLISLQDRQTEILCAKSIISWRDERKLNNLKEFLLSDDIKLELSKEELLALFPDEYENYDRNLYVEYISSLRKWHVLETETYKERLYHLKNYVALYELLYDAKHHAIKGHEMVEDSFEVLDYLVETSKRFKRIDSHYKDFAKAKKDFNEPSNFIIKEIEFVKNFPNRLWKYLTALLLIFSIGFIIAFVNGYYSLKNIIESMTDEHNQKIEESTAKFDRSAADFQKKIDESTKKLEHAIGKFDSLETLTNIKLTQLNREIIELKEEVRLIKGFIGDSNLPSHNKPLYQAPSDEPAPDEPLPQPSPDEPAPDEPLPQPSSDEPAPDEPLPQPSSDELPPNEQPYQPS